MILCPVCQRMTRVYQTHADERIRTCHVGHRFVTVETFVRMANTTPGRPPKGATNAKNL